jgi:hypothetical protein
MKSTDKTVPAELSQALIPRDDLRQVLQKGGLIDAPTPTASQSDWWLAASSLDYWRIAVPCNGAGSKAALLTKLADTLVFPDHFGMNLDALYDCLSDILLTHKKPGAVLLLEGASTLVGSSLNPVLDTLLDVAAFMQTKGHRFCVVVR